MKAMMKKLGMQVEQIEDVQSIVIKTPKGNYIFDSAEVSAMTMQGTTTYQVIGDIRFEPAAPDILKEDITMVAAQANVSEDKAKEALVATKGDIAEAIIRLSSLMIEPGDRVLLIGEGREFFVKAGQNVLSTDKGQSDLASLVGKTSRGYPDYP